MKKLFITLLTFGLVSFFTGSVMAADHKAGNTGGHYNLNIIGFAQCDQNTDEDCFNGEVDDLKFQGNRIFVPIKTKIAAICNDTSETGSSVGEEVFKAQLDGGVRILVKVGGTKIGVLDHDATDGLGKFSLPEGFYSAWARVTGGKPYSCIELNTLICAEDDGIGGVGDQINCNGSSDQPHYVLAGFFDLAKAKGERQKWENVTNDLLPGEFLSSGSGNTGAFDYLWLVYNDGVRVLQIRLKREDPPA